jgi:transcriptional regulator with XRE-family HTH domain
MNGISDKITILRKQKGFSQTDLAKLVGCSREIISKYEKDSVIPSVDIAKRIAEVFEVSLDYLVGNSDIVVDRVLLNKITDIQKLPEQERSVVTILLDAFLRDYKAKQAYS